jgi:outer membrane protein assembly factor BamB
MFSSMKLMTSGCLALVVATIPPVWAGESDTAELRAIGLEVKWRSHVEHEPAVGRAVKLQLYPHSQLRKQQAQLLVDGRVTERFVAPLAGPGSGPQALDIAKGEAQRVADRLKILGRDASVEVVSEPLVFMLVTSGSSAITALDAETGEQIWTNRVGNPLRPTLKADMDDRFVSVVNGMDLYVLDSLSGSLIGTRRLKNVPGSGPLVINNWVFSVGSGGGIFGDQPEQQRENPWSFKTGATSTMPAVQILGGEHFAWAVDSREVYVFQVGERPAPWFRLRSRDRLLNAPVAISDGFVVANEEGVVIRLSIAQTNNIIWRNGIGLQMHHAPLVDNEIVLLIADDGTTTAFNLKDGSKRWIRYLHGAEEGLVITENRIYVRTIRGSIIALDKSSGGVLGETRCTFAPGMVNSMNDRIYLRSDTGTVTCLAEIGAGAPSFHFPRAAARQALVAMSEGRLGAEDFGEPIEPSDRFDPGGVRDQPARPERDLDSPFDF